MHIKLINKKYILLIPALCFLFAIFALIYNPSILPAASSSSLSPHTIVLDAGHGGMDGGASAADGTTEQDINLDIARRSSLIASFLGLKTVLTRTDTGSLDYKPDNSIRQNKSADIHARENITNNQLNPIFISIHLNKFSDTSYFGAQTFWSANNPQSQLLAQNIQSCFETGLSQKRTAKKAENSIYLMRSLTCPAVIVECGFLSNIEETKKLKDEAYRTKLALCIISGCKNTLSEEINNQ